MEEIHTKQCSNQETVVVEFEILYQRHACHLRCEEEQLHIESGESADDQIDSIVVRGSNETLRNDIDKQDIVSPDNMLHESICSEKDLSIAVVAGQCKSTVKTRPRGTNRLDHYGESEGVVETGITRDTRNETHKTATTKTKAYNLTAAGITDLFNQGTRARQRNDRTTAKKIAMQLMIAASVVKSEVLDGDNSDIQEQQLVDWFNFSSVVLSEALAVVPAIRCFYYAKVFDSTVVPNEMQMFTADLLWRALFAQADQTMLADRCKINNLLDEVFAIAQLAKTRKQLQLACSICWELCYMAHNGLLFRYTDLLSFSELEELAKELLSKVKLIFLCHAGCLYEMELYDPAKSMCAKVLTNVCEYDCVEALELWGRVLVQEKEFDIAEKKFILALKYTETGSETEARLNQLLQEVTTEREIMPTNSAAVDLAWLKDTFAGETAKQKRVPEEATVGTEKKKKNVKLKQYERYPKKPHSQAADETRTSKEELPEMKSEVEHAIGICKDKSMCSSSCDGSASTMRSNVQGLFASGWSDSEDDNEDETSVLNSASSIHTFEEEFHEEGYEEETSFYEQSCRFYQEGCENEAQMLYQTLLKSGLELNMSFMHRFQKVSKKRNSVPFYEEFLIKDVLRERMLKKPDIFIKCIIHIEGSHLSYGTPIDVLSNIDKVEISGRTKAGQVFTEDIVVVQLLDSEHKDKNKRYGKVIGIWERKRYKDIKHPVFLCTLDEKETHLVRPMCKTIPKIHILTDKIMKTCPKLKKHKVEVYTYDNISATLSDPILYDINPNDLDKHVFLVAFINWNNHFIYPTGAIIRILPFAASLQRGFELLNLKYQVPGLYQKAVVDTTETITKRWSDSPILNFADRDDLTDVKVFTIDPQGSNDLDDALSVETFEDGFKVGVHIADVSYFVEKDGPIDQEAATRSTTFYPGMGGKLPRHMLPEPLSANICSLLPGNNRLTLSVFFHLTPNGKLKQKSESPVEIMKTVIQSCEQFTYRGVQDIIERKTRHPLQGKIDILLQLATHIRKERLKHSMYALDIADEQDNKSDDSIHETIEAHYIVEEFMIMANKAVAEKLLRTFPDNVPLRCQAAPSTENMMTFLKKHDPIVDTLVKLQDKLICDYKKPSVDSLVQTSEQLNSSKIIVSRRVWEIISTCNTNVSRIVLTDDLFPLQHLVHQHWIALQESAEYMCSNGIENKSENLHYSLQMYPYTHFTSPIRRYIDLVVHRLLHAALTKSTSPYSRKEIVSICSHATANCKRAKSYQRECLTFKQAIDLMHNPKMVPCFIDEVSDRHVTFSAPDLKYVPNVHKELSFNQLDVAYKPDLGTDIMTKDDRVTVTWRKRLYDSRGIATNILPVSHYRDDKKVLNANGNDLFIPLQKWARILKCALEGRKTDMKRIIQNTCPTDASTGLDDISTESAEAAMMQSVTKFSMPFKKGQSIKVQITASPWRGMLTPRPVLFDMTNNIKFCLQHTDDPVVHLSRYSTTFTCEQYTNTNVYLKIWIPLLEMEAAINAVRNDECCVINNVPVRFQSATEGRITLPIGFCMTRNIGFSGTISDKDVEHCFDCFDWMCLRYVLTASEENGTNERAVPILNPVWSGHASVTSVIKKKSNESDGDGKLIVKFRMHTQSPILPEEAKRKGSAFAVEILRKSEVDRRTETYLKRLPSVENTLAHMIALNKGTIPGLGRDRIQMAKVVERDLTIPKDNDVHPLPVNNEQQQEAIDKALNNRFTLIQGPPGTGKTYTGIKLLYLFNKINGMIAREGGEKHQVLFCGPSNKSVDLVARLMRKRLGSLCPKFIRVYGQSIEADDYPIPGQTFLSKKGARNQKADPELSSVTLHHIIRNKGKRHAKEIRAFDRKFRESDFAPQLLDVGRYTHLIREASIDEMKKHDIILCTTAVGANSKIQEASNVFQIIIDEAGMCTEPQCLVPMIATNAKQVVLIGDHKQLRPIIKCKQAAELGLNRSLFQRYAESDTAHNVHFTLLDIQYRMNPQLCSFPSEQFYEGKLKTRPGLWRNWTLDIWPVTEGMSYPHVFIPVVGEEMSLTVSTEEGNEQSKSNLKEVDIVVKLFRYFISKGVRVHEIKVISQYNAQCAEIKNRLRKEEKFAVSTVVSSQGGEWDYVIFSTVRSLPDYKIETKPTLGWCKQNLGFITDENQTNVALTRARKGLVIVGNPNLLRCDKVWGKLISQYEYFNCIRKEGEFPPQRTKAKKKK